MRESMTRRGLTRQLALLGAAGALGGCDLIDRVFGSTKRPLPGLRETVLNTNTVLTVDDAAAHRPMTLPPVEPRTDWPQVGGNVAHAAGNPSLGALNGVAWQSSIGTGASYRRKLTAPPVIAGGTVFAMDTFAVVTAWDAATGARRWRFDARPDEDEDGSLGGGLAFDSGTLFVATGMAELIALNPADGKPRWRVSLGAPARGAPTVADGKVFIPTIDGKLQARAAADGKSVWTHTSDLPFALPLGLPAPAVEGDVVVAGFPSGELFGLRTGDGRVQWSEALALRGRDSLAEMPAVRAWPVIDRGRVYASGESGLTIAVDVRSGRRIWEKEVGGTQPLCAAGDWVFALGNSMELVALSRDDGGVRWITQLRRFQDQERNRDPIAWSAPLLAGGRLLLANTLGDLIQVAAADGKPVEGGNRKIPGGDTLPFAVANDTLYVLSDDATLLAMR